MKKYILGIDGMNCSMCEAHLKDAIFNKMNVKKINASHTKGQAIIFSQEEYNQNDFELVLKQTGYKVLSFNKEEAVKKLFTWC